MAGPVCKSCKDEQEGKVQELRSLIPYTLDEYKFDTKKAIRDTGVKMYLCEHCDEHTIDAIRNNRNRSS